MGPCGGKVTSPSPYVFWFKSEGNIQKSEVTKSIVAVIFDSYHHNGTNERQMNLLTMYDAGKIHRSSQSYESYHYQALFIWLTIELILFSPFWNYFVSVSYFVSIKEPWLQTAKQKCEQIKKHRTEKTVKHRPLCAHIFAQKRIYPKVGNHSCRAHTVCPYTKAHPIWYLFSNIF